MSRSRTRSRGVVGAAAAVTALALAGGPPAYADSIVYIDQGNVWSAEPDGSHRVQLTDGGGWHSPTQADDGTIAAVQGTGPIRIMARDGRPVRTITTPPARSADGGTFEPRPVALAFTADGSRLAYSYVAGSCPVASTCGSVQRSTFYTRADVTEATPHETWGNQFGLADPEWVTNDRALVFGGYGSQVSLDDLGGGDHSHTPWMTPSADQGDGELSRDLRRLVTTFFHGDDKLLAFFAVKGDPRTDSPPPQPDVACSTEARDANYSDPTWSPDGSRVAWASSRGIEVLTFTRFGPGECAAAGVATVLTPTGQQPDWGPTDPPAARWTPPDAPSGSPPAGSPPAAPPQDAPDPAKPAPVPETREATVPPPAPWFTFGRLPSLRGALRSGLLVRVRGTQAGRVVVRARVSARTARRLGLGRRSTTVAVGSARSRGTTATVRVRFTRAARRRLRTQRRVTLSVAHGRTRRTITLRR